MIKKVITYTDFNGTERTDPFYFNISEIEATEMELSKKDGLSERLKQIIEDDDRAAMFGFFKDFILKAYGVKSDDGRRFIKNATLTEEFSQSKAFSILLRDLASDETGKSASEFFNNVLDFTGTNK